MYTIRPFGPLSFIVFHCHIGLTVEVSLVSVSVFFSLSRKTPKTSCVVSNWSKLQQLSYHSVAVRVCVPVCGVCDTPPTIPFLITSQKNTPQSQLFQNIQVRTWQAPSTQGHLGCVLLRCKTKLEVNSLFWSIFPEEGIFLIRWIFRE